MMAGERDCAVDGRVHRGGLKIENPWPCAIEHRLNDNVNSSDFAPHASEQFAFGIIRIAALNQNVNGSLNPRKRVFDLVGQACGQLTETRGVLTPTDFTLVRHCLSYV